MRTEEELLLAAGRGDCDAFALLVERHQTAIVRFVRRYLAISDPATAEDLAQEVFLNAWKYAPAFRGDARAFTWLFRIAVNTCLNHRRRRGFHERRQLTLVDPADQAEKSARPCESDVETRERAERVRMAVADLPPIQRAAILLRHFHELSYVEIAEIMSTSTSAVDSLLHRARQNLRNTLKAEKI